MRFLALFLLLLFPLGQLVRWVVPGTEIVLHPNDLAVAIVLACWVFLRKKQAVNAIFSSPLIKPLLLFGGAIILSLIFNLSSYSWQQLLSSSLYPVRFFAYAGLYFLFRSFPSNTKKLVSRFLLFAAVIIAVTGIWQYLFIPDVSFLRAFDWDDHYFRLVGTFLDPGFTGAILVLGLIFSYLTSTNSKKLLLIPLIYVGMALTYSRASYLMYLVVFAAVAYFKRNVKIFLIAALILVATIPLLPKTFGEGTKLSRENSVEARIQNWGTSLEVWRQNPVFGVGFNTYRFVVGVSPQSHSGGADSSILLVLATTGIVGVAAYLYLIWRMWKLGSIVFKVSLLGIVIHSFFNNTLFYPWIMEWLWSILALAPSPLPKAKSGGLISMADISP